MYLQNNLVLVIESKVGESNLCTIGKNLQARSNNVDVFVRRAHNLYIFEQQQ